jgi:hypothetical protein
LAVELLDHLLGCLPLGEIDEREAAHATGLPVDGEHDLLGLGYFAKQGAQICLVRAVGEIADKKTNAQDVLTGEEPSLLLAYGLSGLHRCSTR